MRPLFKIALAILIGASIVTIYKIYEKKKSRKPGRKITRHVKRQFSEDDAVQKENRTVHDTSSDILHPAPFDNVLGRMPKAGEPTSPRKQRHVDKKTGKLSGRKSDSEMREIDQQDILFQTCQYVQAPENLTSPSSTTSPTTTTTMASSTASGSAASGVSESTQSVNSPVPQVKTSAPDDSAKSDLTPPPAQLPPDTNRKALAEPPTPSLREGSQEPADTPRKSPDDVNRKALAEPPVLSAESAAAPAPPQQQEMLIPPAKKKKSSPSSSETRKEKSREKTNSKTKYKLCRCRFNNRNNPIEDKDAARFVAETKPDIAPTTILPVVFSRYTPQNLLEPQGDVMELPDECFKTDPDMADNYLTPFHPIINATSAAHYHACLISHLIENFDFFE